MSNQRPGNTGDAWVDPERRSPDNAFDGEGGASGEGYDLGKERAEGVKHPSGKVIPQGGSPDAGAHGSAGADIPPDNGQRAYFDPHTGEVHGSGVGAGGGAPGEDYDSDSASGDGCPLTGSEELARPSGEPGPPHTEL